MQIKGGEGMGRVVSIGEQDFVALREGRSRFEACSFFVQIFMKMLSEAENILCRECPIM